MRFVVAGGGVAGSPSRSRVARAGHTAVVLERDVVDPQAAPGRRVRRRAPRHPALPAAPHVPAARAPGAAPTARPTCSTRCSTPAPSQQDLAAKLRGPREPGDEDLVYLWVRRPLIEWALRRAAAAEPGVELRAGASVDRASSTANAERAVRPASSATARRSAAMSSSTRSAATARRPGWPRAAGEPTDSGAIYYCRYFALADGAEHLDGPLLNPRGDLGYMGFNTFRGDNRTYAVILLVPGRDRELRACATRRRGWRPAGRSRRSTR